MKILAVADIHGSQYRLNLLLKNIKKYSPDLVIICGDITQFGPADVAYNFLNQIPIKTYAIMGNIDTNEVSDAINDSKAEYIEKKKVNYKGLSFTGISGVNSFELDHLINSEELNNLFDKNSILVTHVPPYGLQDKVFLGKHAGSKQIREIIDKFKPRLVLSGHIHENPGFIKNKDTIIVNCSMGKRGEGALINIDKDIDIKMLD
jgi:putative phosphoesterase